MMNVEEAVAQVRAYLKEVNVADRADVTVSINLHSLTCSECGGDLDCEEFTLDKDNDLHMKVAPCKCVVEE